MSDEKKYTERDLILAKREGFEIGAVRWAADRNALLGEIRKDAALLLALPKVTRPRVLTLMGWDYRLIDDHFEVRPSCCAPSHWTNHFGGVTRGMAVLFAKLDAHPTEECEDTGDV